MQRKLYNAAYRNDLEEEVTTPPDEPASHDSTTSDDGLAPEEKTFKKRYSDIRSYNLTLTERIKSLEDQLRSAQKKEIQIPSSKEELDAFAARYPDVFRHIRSIAMSELLQERENIAQETATVRDDLEKIKREKGYAQITSAHPDFDEINLSEKFHEWAQKQPQQIQDWLFESSDPTLCIRGLDLYKSDTNFKQAKKTPAKQAGADTLVNARGAVEMPDEGSKKIWKGSEIAKLHPKLYEKFENDIEQARSEGRIDMNA